MAQSAAETFDYVVVGAGSAGCTLAERLSADGRTRVLVLEAGGSDQRFWIKVPVGFGRLFYDPSVNWRFHAEPDAALDGRKMFWPRGKVVGGSGSINALVYCRGLPQDFDDWRAAGAAGWGWDDVRPAFERIEGRIDATGRATTDGPLAVADVSREMHPFNAHYFAAAAELGLPRSDDFNGPFPEGVGFYAITRRNGLRCSAADAFLRPALRRGTVKLATEALTLAVDFEGRRAVGVTYLQGGERRQARARAGVVLAAGAVGSPQLLQASGIGPHAVLSAAGVATRLHAPTVGTHLQDHLAITYGFRARARTLNDDLNSWLGLLAVGARYVLTRAGPLSLSVNQGGGFVRLTPESTHAETQLYCNPLSYHAETHGGRTKNVVDAFSGFILSQQPTRPKSRGRIAIRSADMREAPRIEPNSLSAPEDVEAALAGSRLLRAFTRTAAYKGIIEAPIGPDLAGMDDAALLADFRARANTVYHPCGTCRMGADPATSVVDPGLAVHGVEGLSVADASVFPSITSGNINAPTIMLAYRGGEAIAARGRQGA